MVTRHIRAHGIDLRTNAELAQIRDDGTGRVGSVLIRSGGAKASKEIPAQFVGVGVGVSPNIGFLDGTPLETDRGILVNEFLETNLRDVYAIGDCAQHRTPPNGRKPLEQIWYSGRIMGETLAQTLTGKRTAYRPGIFFNSAKFFDIEYQTYGDLANFLPAEGHEFTFYWQHPSANIALPINYRRDNQAVTGVNVLGMRQRQAVWERWLTEGRPIKYVMEHLPQANFDPEFFRQHEVAIITKYNAENRHQPVALLKGRKGLFGLFR